MQVKLSTALAIPFLLAGTGAAAKCLSNDTTTPAGTLPSSSTSQASNSSSAVVVDLTYALHAPQITSSPDDRVYYNFSNIRYAAPPVTPSLRFRAPADPVYNRSAGVQDGTYGKICPQAYTPWQNAALVTAAPGEHESEDCLFLDVVVPQSLWDSRRNTSKPVIVWIHGGGYQIGAKYGTPDSNPLGLLDRSFVDGGDGVIWVGLNYRLGAFGWLQGSSFTSQGGLANAGLYDQRKALDWVQKYIHLFGGDPNRVTVMGESAGAGAIMHHITAYGGDEGEGEAPLPFQQAIVQSPGYVPRPYASQAESSYAVLLDRANATSLAELAALDTLALQTANKLAQTADFYGAFQFGVAPDGGYVPDLPEKLLARGAYHRDIKVMVAHNTYEGQRYTDPAATNSSAFDEYMALYFPDASAEFLAELSSDVYPAVYNDSSSSDSNSSTQADWTTPFERLRTAVSEFTFTCHAYFLGDALGPAAGRDSYSYLFSVPPGTHTLDVYYSYFVNSSSSVTNETVALYMQEYFASFVETGDPNRGSLLPIFPAYGANFTDLNLNQTFVNVIQDPAANARCDWWRATSYS
ncbi:hypothetical protein PFICI_08586 [Pestalotiopsis fici W106-1]|uniref:Carboxylic ester hydrolase n=1 Tax=Pestalotiopsis fici (strain W106-1 / CGMCC3.15140) TaxID=1229662 RepID=W3WY06_PESFW|nr:uncharacterized protein PFICI_08586 [Pestalotiopsis fici W106-1]ETS78733.1 hypothetical protein PFICI_08586 [Pestalotiopsis fici W106-1]